MPRAHIRRLLLGLLVVGSTGCGSTPGSPAPTLNLAGTWSGLFTQPGSMQAASRVMMTWVATQSGNTISGPETVVHLRDGRIYSGLIIATLAGTQITLTETVARGNIPGFPTCSVSSTGSGTASSTTISATVISSLSACEGFNRFENGSVSEQWTLSKQ